MDGKANVQKKKMSFAKKPLAGRRFPTPEPILVSLLNKHWPVFGTHVPIPSVESSILYLLGLESCGETQQILLGKRNLKFFGGGEKKGGKVVQEVCCDLDCVVWKDDTNYMLGVKCCSNIVLIIIIFIIFKGSSTCCACIDGEFFC